MSLLLADILDEYMYHSEAEGHSKSTLRNKVSAYESLKTFLKEKRGITELESVTTHDLRAYVRHTLKDVSNATVVFELKMHSAFFNWCVREEYLKESPMAKVEYPKVQINAIKGYTADEVIKMIEAFSYKDFIECRNKAIISIFADTGIRNSELRGLKLDDVKETSILINGKGSKQRYVFISPNLKKVLIRYERMRRQYIKDKIVKSDAYFLTYQCDMLSHTSMHNIIKEVKKRTGLKEVYPHKFRHFFSVSFIKNSGDVYTLSRLLGHSDIGITQRYLRSITNEELERRAISSSPLMNLNR